jgi:hypothetical protein
MSFAYSWKCLQSFDLQVSPLNLELKQALLRYLMLFRCFLAIRLLSMDLELLCLDSESSCVGLSKALSVSVALLVYRRQLSQMGSSPYCLAYVLWSFA